MAYKIFRSAKGPYDLKYLFKSVDKSRTMRAFKPTMAKIIPDARDGQNRTYKSGFHYVSNFRDLLTYLRRFRKTDDLIIANWTPDGIIWKKPGSKAMLCSAGFHRGPLTAHGFYLALVHDLGLTPDVHLSKDGKSFFDFTYKGVKIKFKQRPTAIGSIHTSFIVIDSLSLSVSHAVIYMANL